MEKDKIYICQDESGKYQRSELCLETLVNFVDQYCLAIKNSKEIRDAKRVEHTIIRSKKSSSLYLKLELEVLNNVYRKTVRFSNHHNKTSSRIRTNKIFDKHNLEPLDKSDKYRIKNIIKSAIENLIRSANLNGILNFIY